MHNVTEIMRFYLDSAARNTKITVVNTNTVDTHNISHITPCVRALSSVYNLNVCRRIASLSSLYVQAIIHRSMLAESLCVTLAKIKSLSCLVSIKKARLSLDIIVLDGGSDSPGHVTFH